MEVNIFVLVATHLIVGAVCFKAGISLTKSLIQKRLDQIQKDLSQHQK